MQRNITLDYYKIALSILVISIHIQSLFSVDSLLGWFISNGIARIAVPSFFLISGYYLYDKMGDRMVVKKYLLHLLVIYIVWIRSRTGVDHRDRNYGVLSLMVYTCAYFIGRTDCFIPTICKERQCVCSHCINTVFDRLFIREGIS